MLDVAHASFEEVVLVRPDHVPLGVLLAVNQLVVAFVYCVGGGKVVTPSARSQTVPEAVVVSQWRTSP